jgi:hypothetical protein
LPLVSSPPLYSLNSSSDSVLNPILKAGLHWLPWSLTRYAEVVLLYRNKVHDLPEQK